MDKTMQEIIIDQLKLCSAALAGLDRNIEKEEDETKEYNKYYDFRDAVKITEELVDKAIRTLEKFKGPQ